MVRKADRKHNSFQKTKSYHLPLTTYLLLKKAQVMLEFTFCMIILFLMMYGIIMVFRWTGVDLAQRQQTHDAVLTTAIDPLYGQCAGGMMFGICPPENVVAVERGPLTQIDPYFYQPSPMNAVWTGN